MQTRKLTEVPRSEFAKETNFIVEIDEEVKRVPGSEIRQLVTDEETRAKAAEKKLGDDLAAEALRASTAENTIADNLTAEISRASGAEKNLTADLAAEVIRAVGVEKVLEDNIAAEVTRATSAEKTVAADLEAEATRAETAEKVLTDDLTAETTRAKAAEEKLTDDLTAETTRAKAREDGIAADLAEEISRAVNAEIGLAGDLDAEVARANAAENTLTDNLMAETTRATGAERVLTDDLTAEINRSQAAEHEIASDLEAESVRAKAAEKMNADAISAEATRAKAEESKLQNSIQTETGRAEAAEASIRSTIETNRPVWNDKYTKNEIDNKFSALESNTDWKETVATYDDIATTYPVPQDGWTVNVKDTDYTYRWSGEKWVAISANAIPKATQSVDGLLSKEDKAAFDDAYSKCHIHTNKSVLDKITQVLLDNWNAAYSHISDAVKHITAAERTNWNAAHTHISNKSNPHGVTAAQAGAAPASHTHSYLPLSGGTVTGNVTFNTSLTGLDWNMNTDYAKAYFKNTGDGDTDSYFAFETGDNGNEYFRWLQKSGSTTTELMNLKSDGLRVKGAKVAVEGHTHTKSQITDMPTKVSQFTNDSGYITQADVDTSQNHTHANKTVLDKITQALLDTWNGKAGTSVATQTANGLMAAADKKKLDGVAAGANNYVHLTTAGNKHIPAGGSSGQFLKWSANGTAVWANTTTDTTLTKSGVPADAKKVGDELTIIRDEISAGGDTGALDTRIAAIEANVNKWNSTSMFYNDTQAGIEGYTKLRGKSITLRDSGDNYAHINHYGTYTDIDHVEYVYDGNYKEEKTVALRMAYFSRYGEELEFLKTYRNTKTGESTNVIKHFLFKDDTPTITDMLYTTGSINDARFSLYYSKFGCVVQIEIMDILQSVVANTEYSVQLPEEISRGGPLKGIFSVSDGDFYIKGNHVGFWHIDTIGKLTLTFPVNVTDVGMFNSTFTYICQPIPN